LIPYRAMLDVPAELLRYLTQLLKAERRRRSTPARSRKLTCRDQALILPLNSMALCGRIVVRITLASDGTHCPLFS
jgi:hypothetical protein